MKININRIELLKMLDNVSAVISENKIRPVIGCVLFEASDSLKATGTDLDMTIISNTDICEIVERGKCAIQPILITSYLKSIEENAITFESDDRSAKVIINGEIAAEFETFDSSEYPSMTQHKEGQEVNLVKDDFVRSISKVQFAAEKEGQNVALNCIRIYQNEKKVTFAASNSFMMCISELNVKEVNDFAISLPYKSSEALLKILPKINTNELKLIVSDNRIYLEIGSLSFQARLISLPFPNVENIMNGVVNNITVQANVKEFMQKSKTIALFAGTSDTKNAVICNFEGNKLNMKAIGKGKCNEKIITMKEGDDLKLALNILFINDFVKNVDESVITIKLKDGRSAVLLHTDKNDYKLLTMPVSLSNID